MCVLSLVVLATITACANPVRHAQSLAARGGLTPVLLQGTDFQHRSFAVIRDTRLLVLFVEGDGSPWIHGGTRVAADPTPHVPVALELAVATPASVLYLGRPCYLEQRQPSQCTPAIWTSERYSRAVVESMSAAARAFIATHHFRRVLLVGYSGGGTLAVLMTPRLPEVVGVVSIVGNLDPEAWTKLHGYLPLSGSLNPALEPPLPPTVRQWYLEGRDDANVPASVNERYFQRALQDRVWLYPKYDHVCCWRQVWPKVFGEVVAELDASDRWASRTP